MSWPQTDGFIDATQRLVCDNVFVSAGIGAAGIAAIQASNPLAAIGVGITSIALSEFCRDNYNDAVHGSQNPSFQGGQCSTKYRFRVRVNRFNGQNNTTEHVCWGPVGGFRIIESGGSPSGYVQCFSYGIGGVPDSSQTWDFLSGGGSGDFGPGRAVSWDVISVTRLDGLPDNCGSLPPSGPPVVDGPFKPVTYTDPDVTVPGPGGTTINKPTIFNLGGFKIEKLFDGPLVNVDVGGIKVKVDFGKDPPEVTGPEVDDLLDEIDELDTSLEAVLQKLDEIETCVCSGPEVETENLTLAYSSCPTDSDPVRQFASFEVVKDSVDDGTIQLFDQSADLAIAGCLLNRPPSAVEPSVIGQGQSTYQDLVFWSNSLGPDISSVILQLEDLAPYTRNIYKLAGDESESKYGHLDWSPRGFNTASGGPFAWTLRTYYQLPLGHAEGRVRISLKPHLIWTLWDSGERLDVVHINQRRLS